MMKLKTLAVCACTALCAISFTACNTAGKSTLLGKPAEYTLLTDEEKSRESFVQFKSHIESFSASFAEYAYADYKKADNFAVSPLSVYMALSLAVECADGETRNEILSALGVSYGELKENYSLLYRSLAFGQGTGGGITSLLSPANSIWVNEGTTVKRDCIDALSDYYYCHSYSADFANDNRSANKAVRDFIKERTGGLIDQDFNLTPDTLFALINTLYLKALWTDNGKGLLFTDNSYGFKNADGTATDTKLLTGDYFAGRVYEEEAFSAFYTTTYNGYKLKFILPNEGFDADGVFTAENIKKVNTLAYQSADDENRIIYETRCLFPAYKCSYDNDVKSILNKNYGIERLFDPNGCDFSNLLDAGGCCSEVRHVTDLTVNELGIEGASVTVMDYDTSPAPPEYELVYADFVIDRAFGFIITDRDDTTLFSGVVKSV